jgi:hypothetical protein
MTINTNSYPFTSKAQIKAQLAESQEFRTACLLVLYDRQTSHEQETSTTKDRNKMGFMSSHAVHGCRLAKLVLAGEALSEEDQGRVDTIVPRYTKQLASHFRAGELARNPDLAKAAAVFGV